MKPSRSTRSRAATQISPRTIVGRNIKHARTAAGMTQGQLAAALGLSNPMVVSNWERGVYRPSEEHFCALATALARDMAWFYEDRALDRWDGAERRRSAA